MKGNLYLTIAGLFACDTNMSSKVESAEFIPESGSKCLQVSGGKGGISIDGGRALFSACVIVVACGHKEAFAYIIHIRTCIFLAS